MDSLILISILLSSLFIPLASARRRRPVRAVRQMVLTLLAFHTIYVYVLIIVIVRYFVPEWLP